MLFPPLLGRAERQADALWDEGVRRLEELARKAARWSFSGIKPAPVRQADLSRAEEKLADLEKKIRDAENPAPGLGLQFEDEGRPRAVTGVLIGGPADHGEVAIGDEVLRVNGHDVSGAMDVVRWARQDPVSAELSLRGRGGARIVRLEKRAPRYLSDAFLLEMKRETASLKAALAALKEVSRDPRADRRAVASQGAALIAQIDRLADGLLRAQTASWSAAYRRT